MRRAGGRRVGGGRRQGGHEGPPLCPTPAPCWPGGMVEAGAEVEEEIEEEEEETGGLRFL